MTDRMRKRPAVLMPLFLAAAYVLLPSLARGESAAATVDVVRSDLSWTRVGDGVVVQLEGGVSSGVLGALELPLLPIEVLPPPGMRLATVEAVVAAAMPLDLPAPPARLLPPGYEVEGMAPPAEAPLARVAPGGHRRGTRTDAVLLSPVRRAEYGSWSLVTRFELALTFTPDEAAGVVRPRRGVDAGFRARAHGRELDFSGRRAGLPRAAGADAPVVAAAGEAFDPRFNPSLDGSPVDYVIVTNEALAPEFQRLAEWRTRSGYPGVVRSVEWVRQQYPDGVDLAEKVRAFIRDAVEHWGTRWVLLGGDTPVIPVRYGRTTETGGETIPTDLYYQCLDGNWNGDGDERFGEGYRNLALPGDNADLAPDVWVGRLPVGSPEEARVAVDKILTYETAPPVDAGYPASALTLAEVFFPINWNPGDTVLWDGAELAEEANAYLPPGFLNTRLYENHTAYAGAAPETLTTVIQEIDRGYGYVSHLGHGYIQNMAVGLGHQSITIPITDGFTNGDRASVLYAINCTSAAVDFDCIAEHFMNNPRGGAVACIGATRYDYPGTSHFYSLEFNRLVFEEGMARLGQAATESKVPFISLSAEDNLHRWTQFTMIYLGDPCTPLWTAVPGNLSVTHPAEVEAGERTVAIGVESDGAPLAGARVVLFQEGQTYAAGLTDAAGEVTLTVQPSAAGSLLVTVTAPNRLPYRGGAAVAAPTGAHVALNGTAVQDAAPAGNGNGRLEAGETARVVFTLVNDGEGALTALSVQAVSADEKVALGAVPGNPGGLGVGEAADFVFEAVVDPEIPDLTAAPVALTATAAEGSGKLDAVLYVGAPELAIYELIVVEADGDGDGVAEPGETAAVTPRMLNRGAGAALPLTGTLALVEANGATLVRGLADYGGLAAGDVGPGDGFTPFLVRLGPGAGLPVLGLTVADAAVTRWMGRLDLVPPAVPATPVASGASTNITLSWEPLGTPDLARYVVYRADAAEGPFARLSGYDEGPVSYHRDEPLPPFTRHYYRVAAQDSSGNLSAWTDPVSAVTGLPLAENYPVPTRLGTQASPLVTDLDGDGVLDMITGREQIFALHADGSELRDADGDPLTRGPWTNVITSEGFWASPAVGDLTGDGRLELVAASFQEGKVYVWDAAGQLLPGWPRATGTGRVLAMGSPVLGDVTGDGRPEILIHAGHALYAFRSDGRQVIDGDGDPATHGVFFPSDAPYSYASPAVADLDGDGRDEVVFAARGKPGLPPNHGRVYVLDDDGTPLPGWPLTFFGEVTSSPALADMDRDGHFDIVFATGSDSLEVRDRFGASLPGWPRTVLMNQDIHSSPGVADVDGDGDLDVAVVSGNGTVMLWDADGELHPGFPYELRDEAGNRMFARGSPTLANLDADDGLELVFGNTEGWIMALNPDGTEVPGFPLKLDGPADGGILVHDVDGDGMNEMAVSCFDRAIYLYRTGGHAIATEGWTMFRHDARRTGRVGAPVFEALDPRFHLSLLQAAMVPERGTVYLVATRDLAGAPALTLDGEALAPEVVDAERRFQRAEIALEPGTHVLAAAGTSVDGIPGTSERTFDVLAAPGTRGWLDAAHAGVGILAPEPGSLPGRLLAWRVDGGGSTDATGVVPPGAGIRIQLGTADHETAPGTQVRFSVPEGWVGASVARWDGSGWRGQPLTAWSSGRATIAVERLGWFRLTPTADASVALRPVMTLGHPRPNPAADATRLEFSLSGEGRVRAEVFDVRGARVRVLADRVFPAGDHLVSWDGRDEAGRRTAPGVFFLRLTGDAGPAARKLVRIAEGGAR